MRIIKSNESEKDKLSDTYRYISGLIAGHIDDLSQLQNEMTNWIIEEFGTNGPIDINSLAKLARITSRFANYQSENGIGKFANYLQRGYDIWKKHRPMVTDMDKAGRKKHCAIPSFLAFAFFINGEIIKAVSCMMDYIDLIPEDITTKETAIKWLVYLGETELASKSLESWKMEKHSNNMWSLTNLFIDYIKCKDKRDEILDEIVKMNKKIKDVSDVAKSFSAYDLLSYSAWISSSLSNVSVSGNLERKDFPDRTSRLLEASMKAETIVRNRMPGLAPYQFDNTCCSNFRKYFDSKNMMISPSEYIQLSSSIAWLFELRRDWALLNISAAQSRDALSALILNWRVSLRLALPFRIIQSINTIYNYYSIIKEEGSSQYVQIVRSSLINLLSPEAAVVRCSTPINYNDQQGSVRTPVAAGRSETTMIQDVEDKMTNLEIMGEQSFHRISKGCCCSICPMFTLSCNFAAEYMYSYLTFNNFSQQAMIEFDAEFVKIRERSMKDQWEMFRNKQIRPRPPILLNEIYGICAIRWLEKKIESKNPSEVDAESTSQIIENARKIIKYVPIRTFDLFLIFSQLLRQYTVPLEKNYSWMQPIQRKKFVRIGIERAADIIRAVSPFGRRKKIPIAENVEVDQKKLNQIRQELKLDMVRYLHVLEREWRFRMFSYLGRISPDPWEAAFAWAESTSIGARNLIQQTMGKCRKGLVTLSGPEKFRRCVEMVPEDMTIVQIAMADNGNIYMIKLHSDRDPIVIPVAHNSHMVEMMEKFTHLLLEDEKIAKNPGERTPEQFWSTRRAIDARLRILVEEIQSNFLDIAAYILLPSAKLSENARITAAKIEKVTNKAIKWGEAKELVYLAGKMNCKSWEKLIVRFCEMRNIEKKVADIIIAGYNSCVKSLKGEGNVDTKRYTYLVICPELSQFCWERLPIFDQHPYVCRITSIHAFFCQLESLREESKAIPLQVDVQKSYYVLDPENNLGETQRRMREYINKFQWEGTVGIPPSESEIASALEQMDVFFYIGHGSGSKVVSRHTIKQAKFNAISLLMGCGSVRTIPQGIGFDGKSVLLEYAVARCPLIVGCLWTVTDGEIDRYLMRMVDDCFLQEEVTGIGRLRQLAEAMEQARAKSKLKYLTGAAVVMYGLPVVSKPQSLITSVSNNEIGMVKTLNQQSLSILLNNGGVIEEKENKTRTLEKQQAAKTPKRNTRVDEEEKKPLRVTRSRSAKKQHN